MTIDFRVPQALLAGAVAAFACHAQTMPADTSLAVPDGFVKQVAIRVAELTSVSNTTRKSYTVDFADDSQYRAAGDKKRYEKRQEGDKSFARLGLGGCTAFAGGICPVAPFAVRPNTAYTLKVVGRSPQGRSLMYLRLLDENGKNVSDKVFCPKGWHYTKYNIAVFRISDVSSPEWHEERVPVFIPEGVHQVLPVVSTAFSTAFEKSKAEWYDCRELSFTEEPVATQKKDVVFQRRETAEDGSLTLTSRESALRLKASVSTDRAGVAKVSVSVEDASEPPRPRALEVALEWRRDISGWTWHRDWRRDVTVEKDSFLCDSKNSTGLLVGTYPFTSVSKDGKGVAIGTELDDPAFECGIVTRSGISSRRALGLLKRGDHGTSARLNWLVYAFEGDWGFRSAARKYYASQAGKIPDAGTSVDREGMRSYLGVGPNDLPEKIEDFGLAYFVNARSLADRKRAREMGMLVYPYILAWQIPTHDFPDHDAMPPMEKRIAELESWLPLTGEKGYRNFESKSALAKIVLGSMPLQADGTRPLSLERYDSIVHYWRLNVDPRLPKPSAASHFMDIIAKWGLDSIDGVYLDNVYMQDFNNIRPDHLAVMTEPLVYDVETAQPCAHAMQHQAAFVKALADWLHPLGKCVSGNAFSGGALRFNATIMDVFGSEIGCWGHGKDREKRLISGDAYNDEMSCEKRFFAYHRPVSDMLQDGNWTKPSPEISARGIAGYVEHHMFYAFYPGVVTIGGEDFPGYRGWKRYFGKSRQCERDRELFKKAMPLIRRLNKAGWQPETFARSENPAVLIERYGGPGSGKECLITVRNSSEAAADAKIRLCPELGAVSSLVPLWQGAEPVAVQRGTATVRLGPWRTEAYLVSP